MALFLSGRATQNYRGTPIPVDEILLQASQQWLSHQLHALDSNRHINIQVLTHPGSDDLVDLYQRQQATGVAYANDTSCGVGYAPLDTLEKLIIHIEHFLNSREVKRQHPYTGEDIKIMGVRHSDTIELTVSCAFVDRYIEHPEDYQSKKHHLETLIRRQAETITHMPVSIQFNGADDWDQQSFYLTVTGVSAESGDDGQVGRGNRANGLITPYRAMTMEAIYGKNPVTHVGKLYNIVATRIAERLVESLMPVEAAQCYLVSRIGAPIDQPQTVDIHVQLADDSQQLLQKDKRFAERIKEIAKDTINRIHLIQDEFLNEPDWLQRQWSPSTALF